MREEEFDVITFTFNGNMPILEGGDNGCRVVGSKRETAVVVRLL